MVLSGLQDDTVHLVYGILEGPFQSLEAINTSGLYTGLQRVQLLRTEVPTPDMPADVQTMEIRTANVVIPDNETTYWCYVTKLPPNFSRHHIIMVRRGPAALLPTRGPRPIVVLLVHESAVLPWSSVTLSLSASGPLYSCLTCLDQSNIFFFNF